MRFYVGITDDHWFEHLSKSKPDEVNFWRPGGLQKFRAIEPGAPFLFKLHSPRNYIVGGGFFVRHVSLPLSLAWDSFGEKNGADSLEKVRDLIRHRRRNNDANPVIGCTILTEPFFFDESEWIAAPSDWSPNIVSGKPYDTNDLVGRRLWNDVRDRIIIQNHESDFMVAEPEQLYGKEYLSRVRLGQGAFRILVTEAYERKCAITGERTLPVLQAAHIKWHSKSGPNRVNNGLLLRSDLHILFDSGYLTITNDYQVEVSGRIRKEFENGRNYLVFNGQSLSVLPRRQGEQPASEYLKWHRENVFEH